MLAYKLCTLRPDGRLYPLFINKNHPIAPKVWLPSFSYPTKGFAVRKGWHCCLKPNAPHLKQKLAHGYPRVWVECEVRNYVLYDRPESQGGTWVLADEIKVLRRLSDEEVLVLRG